MEKVCYFGRNFVRYISSETIDSYVDKVAEELNATFADCTGEPPIFVAMLDGVFMFASDLMKRLSFDNVITFMKISSYNGLGASDEFKEVLGLSMEIKGRDVIILDEIIDSGRTMNRIVDSFERSEPRSVRVAALIYKPNSYRYERKVVDFFGYEMLDNEFVIGYGMDYDGHGRTLKDIYILDDEK